MLSNIRERRHIVNHIKHHLNLRTRHMKPRSRNVRIRADDLTGRSSQNTMAMGGFLGINVRQYYYVKHGWRMRYPYLPCIIMHGGRGHQSYYPLEVLEVHPDNVKKFLK